MFASAPLIIAVVGETITERSGIVNLSLDGTMLMAAMSSFMVALTFSNVWIGFVAGAIVGMVFAAVVAFGSITLNKSQVAVGFVLTLLGDDLSAFLGQNFTRIPGPVVKHFGIPILEDIPIIGPIFFDQSVVVYFAFILVMVSWWYLNRTQPGLRLRSAGERPEAAFARGVGVNRVRYIYTIVGGALVGIAGACLFAGCQDRMVGWTYPWVGLDCAGDRYFWRLVAGPGSSGRIAFSAPQKFWRPSFKGPSQKYLLLRLTPYPGF